MSREEPETKHLSMAELHEYLARTGTPRAPDPERTSTCIALEAAAVGRPVRGAAVDVQQVRGLAERVGDSLEDARTLIFKPKPIPRRRRPILRVLLLVVTTAVVSSLLLIKSRRSAQSGSSESGGAPAAAPLAAKLQQDELPQQTPAASAGLTPAGSEREAVDLLLSGDTRGALDVYRRLSASADAPPAYATAVRLLEQELKCPLVADGREVPCAP